MDLPNWLWYALGAAIFGGLVGLDLWLEVTKRETMSEWIRKRRTLLVAFAFLFGWLLGHWTR